MLLLEELLVLVLLEQRVRMLLVRVVVLQIVVMGVRRTKARA